MKKNKLIFVFLFFFKFSLFSQLVGYTEVKDLNVLNGKINENSKKINTIMSDFTQEKKLEYLNELIVSKGKFWFKKENNLRWEYTEPYKYIIVLNAGKFNIFDGKKTSVFDINSNRMFKEINDLIISMVQGNLMASGKFQVQAFENKNSYLLKLVPKDMNMKKVIATTEIIIDKLDYSVTKVVMKENETDYTTIVFTNRKFNETISDNIFSFK